MTKKIPFRFISIAKSFSIRILISIESMFWKYLMKGSCCRWSSHFLHLLLWYASLCVCMCRINEVICKNFVRFFYYRKFMCSHFKVFTAFVCVLFRRSFTQSLWHSKLNEHHTKITKNTWWWTRIQRESVGKCLLFMMWCTIKYYCRNQFEHWTLYNTTEWWHRELYSDGWAESLWLESVFLRVNHFIFEQWRCICLGWEFRVNLLKKESSKKC